MCVVDVHAVVVVVVAAVHVVRVEVAFAAAATAKTVTTTATATATSTFSNCVYVCSRYVNARSMYEHTCVHTCTLTHANPPLCVFTYV